MAFTNSANSLVALLGIDMSCVVFDCEITASDDSAQSWPKWFDSCFLLRILGGFMVLSLFGSIHNRLSEQIELQWQKQLGDVPFTRNWTETEIWILMVKLMGMGENQNRTSLCITCVKICTTSVGHGELVHGLRFPCRLYIRFSLGASFADLSTVSAKMKRVLYPMSFAWWRSEIIRFRWLPRVF